MGESPSLFSTDGEGGNMFGKNYMNEDLASDFAKKFLGAIKYWESSPIYITSKVKQLTYTCGNGANDSVRVGGAVTDKN